MSTSPLLQAPGAVPGEGLDAGVAAHYGDPMREQRILAEGLGVVDLSHRGVVTVTGPDRLSWLHSLTSQQLVDLPPRTSAVMEPSRSAPQEIMKPSASSPPGTRAGLSAPAARPPPTAGSGPGARSP